MKKIFLLFMLVITFSAASFGQTGANGLETPRIDKRIELLSIVFRLASNFEYNMDQFKGYVNDIHSHFDKYKDHPVVMFARKLADSNGVGFDAVMAMAIHLGQPPELKPILTFTDKIPERRWGKSNAEKFVELLKEFYSDAKCEEFFNNHAALYRLAEERFKTVFEALDVSWYKQFYGVVPSGSLNIRIGLGNGGANYGPKVVFPDGKEDAYAIMGSWSIDSAGNPVYSAADYLPTLIHEFNHSFINHLIDKNKSEFDKSGKTLFKPVESLMKSQAYPEWNTVMKESLVRASVVMYLKKHSPDNRAADEELLTQIGRGYLWMKGLVDTLVYYENNRDKYPVLESFIPSIITFYNNAAKNSNALFEKCGHVKTIETFANNSNDVSADLKEMKIVFDKPMGKGISIMWGSLGKEHYPIIKNGVKFTDNNSAILITMSLKPDTKYQFELTGQGFKTADGYPLLSYLVEFKTK